MKRLLEAIHEEEISWEDVSGAKLFVNGIKYAPNKRTIKLVVTLPDGRGYLWTLTQDLGDD